MSLRLELIATKEKSAAAVEELFGVTVEGCNYLKCKRKKENLQRKSWTAC